MQADADTPGTPPARVERWFGRHEKTIAAISGAATSTSFVNKTGVCWRGIRDMPTDILNDRETFDRLCAPSVQQNVAEDLARHMSRLLPRMRSAISITATDLMN